MTIRSEAEKLSVNETRTVSGGPGVVRATIHKHKNHNIHTYIHTYIHILQLTKRNDVQATQDRNNAKENNILIIFA